MKCEKMKNHSKRIICFSSGVVLFMFIFLVPGINAADQSGMPNETFIWQDMSNGLLDLNIQTIDVCPRNPQKKLCASESFIYLTDDSSGYWQQVFRLPARKNIVTSENEEEQDLTELISKDDFDEEEMRNEGVLEDDETWDEITDAELIDRLEREGLLEEILADLTEVTDEDGGEEKQGWNNRVYQIVWDCCDETRAYIAAQSGLFRSTDGGKTWQRCGFSLKGRSSAVLGLAVTSPGQYLVAATKEGLFISKDYGDTFTLIDKISSGLVFTEVVADEYTTNGIAAVSESDIYFGDIDGELNKESISTGRGAGNLTAVAISEGSLIFASSDQHIWTRNQAGEWLEIPALDLGSAVIKDLYSTGTILYAATNRGIYRYDTATNSSGFMNEGLYELDIRQLTSSSQAKMSLWCGTATGIYQWQKQEFQGGLSRRDSISTAKLMAQFPSLSEVLAAVYLYAEFHPDYHSKMLSKINQSIYMPEMELTAGMDTDDDTAYDRGKTVTLASGKAYLGPDNLKWVHLDSASYDFQIRMKWYPRLGGKNFDLLNVHKEISRESKRMKKLTVKVRKLYVRLLEIENDLVRLPSGPLKIMKHLEFQRLLAELDALSGSCFKEFDSSIER